MGLTGSFRLQGGDGHGGAGGAAPHLSARRRSNSSRLLSESITAECARVAAYEPLSGSMGGGRDDISIGHSETSDKKSSKGLALLGKIFSPRKAKEEDGSNPRPETAVKKLKKLSSWLPDPERRWPVQGW